MTAPRYGTAARWAGHAKPSMTLDVYGHIVIDEWRDFWRQAYGSRSPGLVSG